MVTPRNDTVIADLTRLADGHEKHLPDTPFVFAGRTYEGPELVAMIRAVRDAAKRVARAHAEVAEATRANLKMQADNAGLIQGAKKRVQLAYSNDSGKLADFGLAPQSPPGTMSTETLLVRAAKSRATRKERRTMGKKQRAAIKGDVTGVVITPVKGEGEKEEK